MRYHQDKHLLGNVQGELSTRYDRPGLYGHLRAVVLQIRELVRKRALAWHSLRS